MIDYRLFKRTRYGKTGYWLYYWKDGRRVFRSTGETAPRAAEAWAKEYIQTVRDDLEDPILKDFAADFYKPARCEWMKRQRLGGHAISDFVAKARRSQLDRLILPKWGKLHLSEIDGTAVERWLLGLDLSNQTRYHLLFTLNIVLKDAKRLKLLRDNPLDVTMRFGVGEGNYRETRPYTVEELARLFPAKDDGMIAVWGTWRWASMFLTIASAGLRAQEARALRWQAVLWTEQAIAITDAAKMGGGIGAPKAKERRVILIPKRTVEALKRWQAATPLPQPESLVWFGLADQLEPVAHKSLENHLIEAHETARIPPGRSLRSFRTTYNTMMRGVLPETVLRAQTGHKSERMTQRYDRGEWEGRIPQLEPFRSLIETAWTPAEPGGTK